MGVIRASREAIRSLNESCAEPYTGQGLPSENYKGPLFGHGTVNVLNVFEHQDEDNRCEYVRLV